MDKIRIDQLLLKKGLVPSRETAQRLILARKVFVDEQPVTKASQRVAENAEIRLVQGLKYVSRGGFKLEKALEVFEIEVSDKVVLDIGVSTGGFTDCLLQKNARTVFAVDVGYGQLAWKLRQDPRVIILEKTNARFLTKQMFDSLIDFAVIDVSFIGSQKILIPLLNITDEALQLLKPQFEASPQDVPRGGVIKDPKVHRKILRDFYDTLRGWQICGLIDSPLEGGEGNREFLVHLKNSMNQSIEGWTKEDYLKKIEELIP